MSDYDVLTIGNAIVDIIVRTDDDFLSRNAIEKGAMTLIDADRADALYAAMGPAIETSGGSAANTVAGVLSLGGRGAYIGKISDDPLGAIFAHDIRAQGVRFETAPLKGRPPTARSMIVVTPDGERSMSTYLGACVELSPADIDEALVASAMVTYFEGYLWDPPLAKEAIRKAAGIAHAHGREVAMTLSDRFCVDRYRAEFLDLIRSGTVDIVFANEGEVRALFETDDLDAALGELSAIVKTTAAVTRDVKGCVVLDRRGRHAVPGTPVVRPLDTTGAGDLFAAGFLLGHTSGLDPESCAKLGNLAAAEIIQQLGSRPAAPLARLPAVDALLKRSPA